MTSFCIVSLFISLFVYLLFIIYIVLFFIYFVLFQIENPNFFAFPPISLKFGLECNFRCLLQK